MQPLTCWFEETVLLKEKDNVKLSYGYSKGQENDPTLNFRHKCLNEWNRGGTVIFTFHIHLSHHQPAKQLNEIGKSALWKPTSRTWTQRTKQFGGGACRDWLHHIRNLKQDLLDLSCYELYSQVCVRERQKHTLKITAYQLWSPSKNHWVAWPFLDLVIIFEKWMTMKRYSYESKAVVQRDQLLRNWEYICLNTDLSFLFFIDMACGSHWAALLLLCWYLQCCRATCHWRSKWKIGKKENTRANLRQVN